MTSLMKKMSSFLALLALFALSSNIFASRGEEEDCSGEMLEESSGEENSGEEKTQSFFNKLGAYIANNAKEGGRGLQTGANFLAESPCHLLGLFSHLNKGPVAWTTNKVAWASNHTLLTNLLEFIRFFHVIPVPEGAAVGTLSTRVVNTKYKKSVTLLLALGAIYAYYRNNKKAAMKAAEIANPDSELGWLAEELQNKKAKVEAFKTKMANGFPVNEDQLVEVGELLDDLAILEDDMREVYNDNTPFLKRVKNAFFGVSSYEEKDDEEDEDVPVRLS